MCGNWSFCYEEYGTVGMRAGTLSTLSQGTETIGELRGADGTNRFAHWRHGHRTEQVEPGASSTERCHIRQRSPRSRRWDAARSLAGGT
ncbi:DUF6461 domain-containing protein [Streptomyces sp. NPDC046631]|uniref:DUF6461 domain-containing protein n=1 Tax=unclassified Streptomyces TaxID=2593676 RepID=UPI0033F21800